MSLQELQTWLTDQGIRDALADLTRRTVRTEIDELQPDAVLDAPDAKDALDWHKLIFAGSILARSGLRSHQEAALRIATGAVALSDRPELRDAGAVLLGKLANFRAVELANKRDLLPAEWENRLGLSLRLEAQQQHLDHSVLVESTGRWLQVNEFQQRFWESADQHSWISASAPTASGKSFIVLQWLIDQMKSKQAKIAVYLAPTRALVSEIETSLLALLGNASEIAVSSLPLRDQLDLSSSAGTPLILVFTQERLHLLANNVREELRIDLLIVDEAHKIGDNQRGVILQDAIERVSRTNPNLKVVFISPATQNPEELLSDAPFDASAQAVESDAPTVLQNLILARQVPRKPKLWDLTLQLPDGPLAIGTLQLPSSPAGTKKRLAFIAAAAGKRGGTLVYANGAAEAEDVAELIEQLQPVEIQKDRELSELADLARKGVHPLFRLAAVVERGVAFHYGNMPSLIRLEIERLFRAGKIHFLVCTSTLIEGVNLSCRTIVLRGPRKGRGHPMEPHDFWNLAGRAGRWGDEFQGNIICVDPQNAQAWPNGVPQRTRFPIKRESDAVIEHGDGLAQYLMRRANTDLGTLSDTDDYEQVGAYLLSTYARLGSLTTSPLAKRHSPESLAQLEECVSALAQDIDLDAEMIGRHPGVSAVGLQQLLLAFRSYVGDPENLLPAGVDSDDSYDRFITIMERINAHLFPAFSPNGAIPLYSLIVVQWLKGLSLAEMIRKSVDYHKRHNRPYKLPVLIRGTMELVEQVARFRAPKYISAYLDVLELHLREIGRDDLIESGIDIGTQLEFGLSSRTLLSLMELGLSRMSAVALYERIARDDLDKDGCIQWASERRDQLEGLGIPVIIVREIRAKLLALDAEESTSQDA